MLFGNKIKKIAITAPAGQAKNGTSFLDFLQEQGYDLVYGDTVFSHKHPYFPLYDKERAEELQGFFTDESIDLVLCYRGGYGSLRLLEYLDFELMAQSKAYFIGYSDITILHTQLASYGYKRGIIAPMAKDLRYEVSSFARNSLLSCFSANYDTKFEMAQGVNLRGELYPMNLASLQCLIGTPYMPKLENKILCLEDVNEPAYKIDRMLRQLLLSNDLDKASAIILGKFIGTENRWFIEEFANLSVPVIGGFPFSHNLNKSLCMPFGREVTIQSDSDGGRVKTL